MMRLRALAAVLLTITVIASGTIRSQASSERWRKAFAWNLLGTPRFKTLQGKIQVTVFLPSGPRSWTADLWADEDKSRGQISLPHPEGMRQIVTFTLPDGFWILLPFAKQAIKFEGSDFPSWRDIWQIRTDKLDMAKNNYILKVVGRGNISGHFCLVLRLVPKAKGNAIRKIWVHPPTRLPLQVERYSPDGRLEVRVTLIEAKINEPLPVMIFEPSVPPDWTVKTLSFQRKRVDLQQANEILGFTPILPTWVPPGYELEGIFVLGEHRWKLAHIIYTDGLGVISVFQHPKPPKRKPPAAGPFSPSPKKPMRPSPRKRIPFGRPPASVFPPIQQMFPNRVAVREVGNLMVVLVSEVSQEWLDKMANSFLQAER